MELCCTLGIAYWDQEQSIWSHVAHSVWPTGIASRQYGAMLPTRYRILGSRVVMMEPSYPFWSAMFVDQLFYFLSLMI